MISFEPEQSHDQQGGGGEGGGGGGGELLSIMEEAALSGDVGKLHQVLQADQLFLDKLTCSAAPLRSNPLHVAALRGHASFVAELLRHKPALATELNSQGSSVLHLVAAGDQEEVVKELLRTEVGIQLCLVGNKDGLLPIHLAASKGRIAILHLLFDASPGSAKMTTPRGDTILHLAVISNAYGVISFLVDKMKDDEKFLKARDAKGNNILHLAVEKKQSQTVSLLLDNAKIEVNTLNYSDGTPLDVLIKSTENEEIHLMEMLLKKDGTIAKKLFLESSSNSNLEEKSEMLLHETLMTVATFIATITSQEGLKPVEGYLLFHIVGLFTSLSIILMLILVTPGRHKRMSMFLTCLTCISVISTALGFLTAMIEAHPDFTNMSEWLRILIIHIAPAIYLFQYMNKKQKKKKNRRDDRQGNFIKNTATCIIKTGAMVGIVFVITAASGHAFRWLLSQLHESCSPTDCQSLVSESASLFNPTLTVPEAKCPTVNYRTGTEQRFAINNITPVTTSSAIGEDNLDTVHKKPQSIGEDNRTPVLLLDEPVYNNYDIPPT